MDPSSGPREHPQLRAVPLFSQLPLHALDELDRHTRRRSYAKGAILVNEGDAGNELFIVCSGSLKVYLNDDQGREVILSVLGHGDHFGELALLDGAPRSASVEALERSDLLVINKPTFEAVLHGNPACMDVVVRELVGRVRELSENVRALALVDVFGRIARLLLSLAREDGDTQVVHPRPTQQDIASRIGASREMVSRVLKELVVGGYLSIEADRMVIHRKFPSRW
ncbi:Crp/Fnr family transcriptional regulator [Eleftheria terrae]|uniref:Crp/Fnr family transcriptional regulator n=1 Tax=Eleftheria terrae TaxID=1597781 RepID=UPI00263B49CF|nr:Crp/Fnr family transcriptional regulator [Eleftheria terrae]WKB53075.1 Crp/Fnr family transcriptional regulator [Eleftheria terrae]